MEWKMIFLYSPIVFYSLMKIFHSIYHSTPKFSSIFHSILPYLRSFKLEAINFTHHLHLCNAVGYALEKVRYTTLQRYKDLYSVIGMHRVYDYRTSLLSQQL